MTHHSAHEEVRIAKRDANGTLIGFGAIIKASTCVCSTGHRPIPTRFVWHHILPLTCGGQTVETNLVEVCDNCHYSIHGLLYQLKLDANAVLTGNKNQIKYARQGYAAAVAAGTVANIPKES